MLIDQPMLNDELLDLVDNQDRVIGQILRSKMWQDRISNVRVVNAFLINDKNELWIPKRTAHKKIFPSCLDFSVGGFVMAGETYLQAFERETKEELNLDISLSNYSFLSLLTPEEHKVSCFMHIYCIRTNSMPHYNKNDFESSSWMSINDLKKSLADGVPVKGDFHEVLLYIEPLLNLQ
jgi:isopentenyldiphosphate isomerase